MATLVRPASRQARMTRTAISPRFARRTFRTATSSLVRHSPMPVSCLSSDWPLAADRGHANVWILASAVIHRSTRPGLVQVVTSRDRRDCADPAGDCAVLADDYAMTHPVAGRRFWPVRDRPV